ncbi:putative General secretion pathway protein C [Candidatus Contendobacter odensis Run_B_J11]|uniref:General secretion pathway protein C n=1 Tax=Candidatus Contendobacter odensis Run_B_J11 TaxID=1400861 RepID=A0A7U7GA91_9GAMM|nr:putative General secretion pathway protein C [Candidatus Contendobacter odensis Run_B_J11]
MISRPEAWLRIAVVAVNAVLVIALARALAGLTLAFLVGSSVPTAAVTAPVVESSASAGINPTPTDYTAIVAWHLFGRLEAGRPVEAPPAPLPVTPLNLRLVGVFFIERGGDRALALIADGSGPERGYRIGEPLPGGARLERVQRDHVVVSRNGRQEVLNLPKLGDPNSTPSPASLPVPDQESGPTSSVEPRVIDASAMAQRLRGEMATRPQALEDIAFASSYVQNGQFVGFRLRPGRDQQLLRQLGLNSGDVITEINGSRLNNPMQGFSMLQEVMSADQVSVRVLRSGAEIPLIFSLSTPLPR